MKNHNFRKSFVHHSNNGYPVRYSIRDDVQDNSRGDGDDLPSPNADTMVLPNPNKDCSPIPDNHIPMRIPMNQTRNSSAKTNSNNCKAPTYNSNTTDWSMSVSQMHTNYQYIHSNP